jgi:PTH1 family peptidyl-tRNA hydrolase
MASSTQYDSVAFSLIVGLGNPGAKYSGTRHNIGFEMVDRLSKSMVHSPERRAPVSGGVRGWFASPSQRCICSSPRTYMNRSGQSMRVGVGLAKAGSQRTVLVVYDEMDLPMGRLRLRLSGSAGGHNGMKSAIAHLGTQEFPRLRIGISAAQRQGS